MTHIQTQQWNVWIRNVERYVIAANIKVETRKQALFLNIAGENVVQIFDSLSSTDTLNYSNMVILLAEHFALCRNVLYDIFTLGNADNEMMNHSIHLFKVEKPFREL